MKNVIGISLGAQTQDFVFRTRFLGQSMQVQRLGAAGSTAKAARLLRHWNGKADAIGLGLIPASDPVGSSRQVDGEARALRALSTRSPLTTGARLAEIFLEWAVRHAQTTLGHYFDNANVLFFSGLAQYKLATSMAEYTENLHFADPLLQLGVPKLLTSLDALNLYASGAHIVSDWVPPRAMPGALLQRLDTLRAAQGHAPRPPWSWRRCTNSTTSASRNWPARPSSPPPSTTNAWRASRTRACTW